MVSAGDFRKGMTVEIDGQVWVIVDFLHVKPGKGAAFVRTKLKNVMTRNVLERTFNPSDKYPLARIERKQYTYSYNDGSIYYFMDPETFDLLPLNHEMVEDALKYIKENMDVTISFYNGSAFNVEAPNFVELEVIDTDPNFKGNTATAGNKPATLETGARINVPMFVNVGDIVRIDTRTDEYLERAK